MEEILLFTYYSDPCIHVAFPDEQTIANELWYDDYPNIRFILSLKWITLDSLNKVYSN